VVKDMRQPIENLYQKLIALFWLVLLMLINGLLKNYSITFIPVRVDYS